jgi:hypothetical protein
MPWLARTRIAMADSEKSEDCVGGIEVWTCVVLDIRFWGESLISLKFGFFGRVARIHILQHDTDLSWQRVKESYTRFIKVFMKRNAAGKVVRYWPQENNLTI